MSQKHLQQHLLPHNIPHSKKLLVSVMHLDSSKSDAAIATSEGLEMLIVLQ